MPKISSYVVDNVVNGRDKVIGTDADNFNQTKNYTIDAISNYTLSKVNQGNNINGDIIWSGVGLIFQSTLISGSLNGFIINIPQDLNIELDQADPDDDRIDLFVVNENNTLTVIKGTPSANPQKPNINEASQYEIGLVLIKAAQTTPDGITLNLVYDEDTGQPNEWDVTVSDQLLVDPASTLDPYLGTKSIQFNDVDEKVIVDFEKSTPVDIAKFDSITFKLKKSTNTSQLVISVILNNSTEFVGLPVNLFDGQFGFSDSIYDEWQNITIDRSAFNLNTFGDFDGLRFVLNSFDGFIDRIQINESDNLDNSTYVRTETNGEPTGSDQVFNVVSLTQAEYDAGTPVATTFYIITDA